MKKIISMLFAVTLVLGFVSNANAAKTLKCQTVLNTKADEVKMLKDFTDTVTTLTSGSLKFEILPAGAVVGVKETLDAVDKGFKLQPVDASILHMENTTIDLFVKKIRSFSKNYFFKFYEKNKEILRDKRLELNTPNMLHSYLIKMASMIFYLRENVLVMKI